MKIKLTIIIVGWIIISIVVFSDKAKADFIRLQFDVALELPLTKAQEDKLEILKAAMADLKIDFKNVTNIENTTKSHVCKHDTGGSCIEEKNLEDTDFTKINPIPTPKPTPK